MQVVIIIDSDCNTRTRSSFRFELINGTATLLGFQG